MNRIIKKIFYWYFSRSALPYWGVLGLDMLFVAGSLLVCQAVSEPAETATRFWQICGEILIYLVGYVVAFRIFHTYSGVIRYSSFVDLWRQASAVVLGLVIALVLRSLLNLNETMAPIRAIVLTAGSVMALLLMWLLRIGVKYLYDTLYACVGAQKVFVYGVRSGGVSLAKSIRNQDPAQYVVAGFLTDEIDMSQKMLMGVHVYQATPDAVNEMRDKGAKILFVSPARSEMFRRDRLLVDALIEAGIKIFMVPPEVPWDGHSELSHSTLREVEIEDLLPRQTIEVDMEAIGSQLKGKKILVTGAAGSIGSEIARQVAAFGPSELVLVDQAESPLHDIRIEMNRDFSAVEAHTIVADIADRNRMARIFDEYEPEYVFHAAAYKHVPMMEDDPGESIRNNVGGTKTIADLSVSHGARKFVMVSTDKAVNPTNVMGASKRLCEIYVQSLDKHLKEHPEEGHTQFVTTRFGNVLGSNGSVIPLFREQIRRGGPVTVTHPDIIRYFMLIPEACRLVLEAGTMGHGGEIFVFDMGEPVRIVDLANRMIKLSGSAAKIVYTGLRDGEKLYEETLSHEETSLPTFHPKINIARVREYNHLAIIHDFEALISMAKDAAADDFAIVAAMKRIVPEYRSQHSRFESLDAQK